MRTSKLMGRALLHLYRILRTTAFRPITVLISTQTFPLAVFLGLMDGDPYSGRLAQHRDISEKMEFKLAICSFSSASSVIPLSPMADMPG
jgi:hypothetical protein